MPTYTITLQDARDMTAKFRANRETILDPAYRDRDTLPICETYDRAAFDAMLAVANCTGVRIYFGMNREEQVRAIIVAVDADDNDILPSETVIIPNDAVIVEDGRPCPDFCPTNLL